MGMMDDSVMVPSQLIKINARSKVLSTIFQKSQVTAVAHSSTHSPPRENTKGSPRALLNRIVIRRNEPTKQIHINHTNREVNAQTGASRYVGLASH